jgi:hypothetical protein
MVTCTPDNLAELAKCYVYLPARIRKAIRILNYCAFLNSSVVECDPDVQAAEAKCFAEGLSDGMLDAIETYLLCQMANSV